MGCKCTKHRVVLVWGFLECLFFSGLLSGWSIICQVLEQEKFFGDGCADLTDPANASKFVFVTHDGAANGDLGDTAFHNYSYHYDANYYVDQRNASDYAPDYSEPIDGKSLPAFFKKTKKPKCKSQVEALNLVYVVSAFTVGILTLPIGFMYDRCGTLKTRIVAIFIFTTATMMMAFTSTDQPLLLYPVWILLGLCGTMILISNLQIANLFGEHRATVIMLFYGAYDSSAFTLLLMRSSVRSGLNIHFSFMFLTASVIPLLIGTIAFLPKMRIPWPLPENYGSRPSTIEYFVGENVLCAMQRRDSSAPAPATRRQSTVPPMQANFQSPLYLCQVLWFAVLSLRLRVHNVTVETRIVELSHKDNELVELSQSIYMGLQFCGVFCAPILGLVLDREVKAPPGVEQVTLTLKKYITGHVIILMLMVLFCIMAFVPILALQYITFALGVITRVSLAGSNAAFIATMFPHHHFGKLYGFSVASSVLVGALQHPLSMVPGTNFSSTFHINMICLLLVLPMGVHPYMMWKRRGLEGLYTAPTHCNTDDKINTLHNHLSLAKTQSSQSGDPESDDMEESRI